MFDYLVRHWWLLVVRGVLAVLFGLMALIWPGITLAALAIVFGAYALVDGIFAGVGAFRAQPADRPALIAEAVLGIVFGIIALAWPGVTVLAIALLAGFWALVTGIAEIYAAIKLRKEMEHEWLLAAAGLLSVFIGVLILIWPGGGALAVAIMLGIYALVFGIAMIVGGFRLHGQGGTAPRHATPQPS